MKKSLEIDNTLYTDIKKLIEETRLAVAQTVNIGITVMYWNIGQKINEDILKNKRAEYGKQIIVILSQQLTEEYGKSFTEKNLRRMIQFNEAFPDFEIVVSAIRQLSWTHFIALIPLKNELQREFYAKLITSQYPTLSEPILLIIPNSLSL